MITLCNDCWSVSKNTKKLVKVTKETKKMSTLSSFLDFVPRTFFFNFLGSEQPHRNQLWLPPFPPVMVCVNSSPPQQHSGCSQQTPVVPRPSAGPRRTVASLSQHSMELPLYVIIITLSYSPWDAVNERQDWGLSFSGSAFLSQAEFRPRKPICGQPGSPFKQIKSPRNSHKCCRCRRLRGFCAASCLAFYYLVA